MHLEVTTKDLRSRPGKIIERVSRGAEITVTYRGKPLAKIVPLNRKDSPEDRKVDEIFGMWKDRRWSRSVDEYVRRLRKGRAG